MYDFLKKNISKIISRKRLIKIEPFLRFVYSIFKAGNSHLCLICNFNISKWIILPNNERICPKCGSLPRDRRLWKLLKTGFIKENITVLDFSPSRSLFRQWKKEKNINYIASDLSANFISDVFFDITKIPVDSNSFDLIICYHILEHITEDTKAIKELYRILKPNGHAIIQTPFKDGDIYEDETITSDKERLLHFGQEDHVRIYSIKGLKKRLEVVGFHVKILALSDDDYLGFNKNENIIIVQKIKC